MNKEVARFLANTAFRSSANLADLVSFMKEHCSVEEQKIYSIAIATAMTSIQMEVLGKLYKEFPEIEEEFQRQIEKYGRPL
jgi:hypothetical protein